MKKLFAFDFDGTLTTVDTLLEFIRYAKGSAMLYGTLLLYLPLLVLMKLHLYSNERTKEKVFSRLFRGMRIEEFDSLCHSFAKDNIHLLRPKGVEYLREVQKKHDSSVVIISASLENWVRPFFELLNLDASVYVVATVPEVRNGVLTGHFFTSNCYGAEKVSRLLEMYPDRDSYHLTAFGDSRGDRELLGFADEAYYKPFRS